MALIAPEIGIDLGTSNTMVYVRGRGIVVSEPTIVVIDSDNNHNYSLLSCDIVLCFRALVNKNT